MHFPTFFGEHLAGTELYEELDETELRGLIGRVFSSLTIQVTIPVLPGD